MFACQVVIVVWLALSSLASIHISYSGRTKTEPGGFPELLFRLLVQAVAVAVLIGAGAFSMLPVAR